MELKSTPCVEQGNNSRDMWSEFRLAILLIGFAHLCDLVSTYFGTPDLTLEVSPLYLLFVSNGISGWPVMIGIKFFALVTSIWAFRYYQLKRCYFYPETTGQSFHEFLHHTHGIDAMRRPDGSWIAPSPHLLGIWAAFVYSIGSAAHAFFLTMHNLFMTPFVSQMAEGIAQGITFFVLACVFWYTLYRDYQRKVTQSS